MLVVGVLVTVVVESVVDLCVDDVLVVVVPLFLRFFTVVVVVVAVILKLPVVKPISALVPFFVAAVFAIVRSLIFCFCVVVFVGASEALVVVV
jgi:hypothetical protein